MENLTIEGSDTIPHVEMISDGIIKISGRALVEDAFQFFQPILLWVREYNGSNLHVDLNLEYFNTSVSKQLHDFLNIVNSKPESCELSLKWSYEEGDDEMQESGEIYKELFPRFKFEFNEYEEILD